MAVKSTNPKKKIPTLEDRQLLRQELMNKFSRVFGSSEGRQVLDTIQAHVGIQNGIELPTYGQGMSSNDVIARDAAKQVVLYIMRMSGAELKIPQRESENG
ncbi:MAG: hypothetical protein Unbinned1322contig1001_10 [Prokaryotic dsDNA virus sp.]|nr:MAG: hypothetical protein Unbinned1322contig1001_10 [Prokaryotic dsDNA virus sp.]|tara:strand:- start:15548 stop:15850 length:303 start_codon:yes stop_codon:yes gene_type:complete